MLRGLALFCCLYSACGFSLSPKLLGGSSLMRDTTVFQSYARTGARTAPPGALGLRSLDKTDGWGWEKRPPTSIGNDNNREVRSRVSVTSEMSIKGVQIKYDYLPGSGPAIMYLPALNRTRHGETATNLKTWCRRNGRSFIVADYFGVGQSGGEYKDASISRWTDDTCTLIDFMDKQYGQNQVILVGAGVGGWVMLHSAQKMARSVVGLVGVAADPDFTEDVVMPKLSEEVKQRIMTDGQSEFEWGGKSYTLTKSLVEDGKKMTLLDKGKNSIDVSCPVHLIQGLGDEEIPPEKALKISECIKGEDVTVTYVKYGSHEMDDDEDFKRIHTSIQDIDRQLGKADWQRSISSPV